jgi:hypothetical protein
VQKFQGELMKGAGDVLTAQSFSYELGQKTLLDLLDPQKQTTKYLSTTTMRWRAPSRLSLNSTGPRGLWDVEF